MKIKVDNNMMNILRKPIDMYCMTRNLSLFMMQIKDIYYQYDNDIITMIDDIYENFFISFDFDMFDMLVERGNVTMYLNIDGVEMSVTSIEEFADTLRHCGIISKISQSSAKAILLYSSFNYEYNDIVKLMPNAHITENQILDILDKVHIDVSVYVDDIKTYKQMVYRLLLSNADAIRKLPQSSMHGVALCLVWVENFGVINVSSVIAETYLRIESERKLWSQINSAPNPFNILLAAAINDSVASEIFTLACIMYEIYLVVLNGDDVNAD